MGAPRIYCRRLIVKNAMEIVLRSQPFEKNFFVASMIGSQAERFLATKQVTDHPARREKSLRAEINFAGI